MKRSIALFGVFLLLTACTGGSVTGSYDLTIRNDDPTKQEALTLAAMRVLQRRIESMQVPMLEQTLRQEEGTIAIDVHVDDPATIELLTEQLTRPFSFRVMAEAPAEEADATVEGYGGFRLTDVTEEEIAWVETAQDEEGKGAVRILFTESGQRKMQALMETEQGNSIGVFVRDVLMSVLPAATSNASDITIRGIPEVALAEIFADDVNVGTFVHFTPHTSLPSLP